MLISRWIVPTWEARYDELAIAELVALPSSRIAARASRSFARGVVWAFVTGFS